VLNEANSRPPDHLIRKCLSKILEKRLKKAPLQQRLLTKVVELALDGKWHEIKGETISEAAFGGRPKPNDSRVRSLFRHLRKNLRKYYNNEGSTDTMVIEIPKGSCAPEFRWALPPGGADTFKRLPKQESSPRSLKHFDDKGQSVQSDLLFLKTWEVSGPHLATSIPPERYTPQGTLKDSPSMVPPIVRGSERRLKYAESLFVPPQEISCLDDFITSAYRALFIVGESGIGKTNLLCHYFLKLRQQGEPALFVSARRLTDPHLDVFLETHLLRRLSRGETIAEFDEELTDKQKTITIFLDAVNEYNADGNGPIMLLNKLVTFIQDVHLFRQVRLIATCRRETWALYKQDHGAYPLDPNLFSPGDGDALLLNGFTEGHREALYAQYQHFYHLNPIDFDALSDRVKHLVQQPLLMSVIAETYDNRMTQSNVGDRRISKQLDSYAIFGELTKRKLDDALLLVNAADPERRQVRKRLTESMVDLARLILNNAVERARERESEQTTSRLPKTTTSDPDCVAINDIVSAMPTHLSQPLTATCGRQTLDVLLELDLIRETMGEAKNIWNRYEAVFAYRFFHDGYAEFWLSLVYQKQYLGPTSTKQLRGDSLELLAQRVEQLISFSTQMPILGGALEHWLHENMRRTPDKYDFLLPLLNRLARESSGVTKYYLGAFLSNLPSRASLKHSTLWRGLLQNSAPELNTILAESFIEFGKDQPAGSLRAFLDHAASKTDRRLIQKAADVFAHLFASYPTATIAYLSEEIDGYEALHELVFSARHKRHFAFVNQFLTTAALTSIDRPDCLDQLLSFVGTKYRIPLAALTATSSSPRMDRLLKYQIIREAHKAGENHWKHVMAGHNDDLFSDPKHVQQVLLRQFYPYLIQIHNDVQRAGQLLHIPDFRTLAVQMLDYRPESLVGYTAATALAVVFREGAGIEEFIESLLVKDTQSLRYHANLLLVNMAFVNQSLCPRILNLIKSQLVPALLTHPSDDEWHLLGFTTIGALDFDRYWETCEELLTHIGDVFAHSHSPKRMLCLGEALAKCNYYPNRELGSRISRFFLRPQYLADELWHPVTLRVLAGLLTTNPTLLRQLLLKVGVGEELLSEVQGVVGDDLAETRERVFQRSGWNRFTQIGLYTNSAVRYFLLKTLLRSGVTCRSIADIPREYSRFVQELANALFGKEKETARHSRLSIEDVFSTDTRRPRR